MSKASFEIITSAKRESFVITKFDKKAFEAPFHFHPQLELTCITKGKGKRFVGNNMTGFENTDVVLIGCNLPHCWKLTPPDMKASAIVIQFNCDFLGESFFDLPEMSQVKRLLKRSESGIEFRGKTKEQIRSAMELMLEKNHFDKVISLLEILNKLSVTKEYVLLNKKNSVGIQSDDNRERINKVFAYIVENFHDEILLNDASSTIGMTPNAFCKYFKKMTRKTFMETVIDYRINFATQQLVETDKSVADVCFESGFRDMSHFYKTFSSRMEMSPLNYRKHFLRETDIEELSE
ncbi:MAG TPA: AraC family transcriptional regulator [Hanamia sp.]|nr:AraC family transcriptional regulator [Hanamia sp.]